MTNPGLITVIYDSFVLGREGLSIVGRGANVLFKSEDARIGYPFLEVKVYSFVGDEAAEGLRKNLAASDEELKGLMGMYCVEPLNGEMPKGRTKLLTGFMAKPDELYWRQSWPVPGADLANHLVRRGMDELRDAAQAKT